MTGVSTETIEALEGQIRDVGDYVDLLVRASEEAETAEEREALLAEAEEFAKLLFADLDAGLAAEEAWRIAILAEQKRNEEIAAAYKAKADRCKKMVAASDKAVYQLLVEVAGGERTYRHKSERVNVGLRQNPRKVDLAPGVAADFIPEEFQRVKRELDKVAAKKAMSGGAEIPGVVWLDTTYSLDRRR